MSSLSQLSEPHRDAAAPTRPLRIPLVEAAAAGAAHPPGAPRWFARPTDEGLELRTVVRRWSEVAEQPARISRIAGGAALRAARLAIAVQGRSALVSRPDEPGLLAVLRAGMPVRPRPEDLVLNAVMHDLRSDPVPKRPAVDPEVARPRLRRAAEAEGAWLRTVDSRDPVAPPSTRWSEPGGPVTMRVLLGALGRNPAADLRLGQAIEAVRLTAAAFGLGVSVAGLPSHGAVRESVAVLEVWRPARGRGGAARKRG